MREHIAPRAGGISVRNMILISRRQRAGSIGVYIFTGNIPRLVIRVFPGLVRIRVVLAHKLIQRIARDGLYAILLPQGADKHTDSFGVVQNVLLFYTI